MITKIEGKCAYEGCEQPATVIACGRGEDDGHPEPACYCEAHGLIVEDEGHPEYGTDCPNCGCLFGVN